MTRRRKQIGALAIAVAALAMSSSLAGAELTANGDLFVKFSGGIMPTELPRNSTAPITVTVAGTVRTLSGHRPPSLQGISIALNRGGRLDANGLPICHQDQISPSSTEQALEECGGALVGRGTYRAGITLPEQAAFVSQGRILAFNARIDGRRAILAQVYGGDPAPIGRVIVFRIHERGGTFGTVLSGTLKTRPDHREYLRQIRLSLHRDFIYKGRPRSYLSASCPAPGDFDAAVFPFAHASMSFDDGRTLSSTLTRTCKVLP